MSWGKLSPKDQFEAAWAQADGPKYRTEYQFDKNGRRWRFDYCWRRLRVAVEIEGGTFGKFSRHSHGPSMWKDCDKYNAAAIQGWTVVRLTNHHLAKKRIGKTVCMIIDLLTERRQRYYGQEDKKIMAYPIPLILVRATKDNAGEVYYDPDIKTHADALRVARATFGEGTKLRKYEVCVLEARVISRWGPLDESPLQYEPEPREVDKGSIN